MDRLQILITFLQNYSVAYRVKYLMGVNAQVDVSMLAKNTSIVFSCLPPSEVPEPTIVVGGYWFNGSSIRKCISNTPSGTYQRTYQDVTDFTAEFGSSVQLSSESIAVGPGVPLPDPPQYPSKGALQASDGRLYKEFAPGTEGYALTINGQAPLGLQWRPIVTLNGNEALTNKTLVSPRIEGVITGSYLLDEDNMQSNSAARAPSQRSVKNYVTSSVSGVLGSVSFSSVKVNIYRMLDGVHFQIGEALFNKNNSALSSAVSNAVTPGTTQQVGTVDFELETSGRAVGVSFGATINNILSVSLVGNNCGQAITPVVGVDGAQLQVSVVDVNGVALDLTQLANNTLVEVVILYS